MRFFLLVFLAAPAAAGQLSSLDLLQSIAAESGVPVADLPAAPKPRPVKEDRAYEGLVRVSKKSPDWRRPKEALKDRSLLLDSRAITPSGKSWAWLKDSPLSRTLPAGRRAWIQGRFAEKGTERWPQNERMLELSDAVVLPGDSAQGIPAKAQSAGLAVEVTQVFPWCDHMPIMEKSERRQRLMVSLKLKNKTDKPLSVSLSRAFLSFDATSEGTLVSGLSIRGANGLPTGQTALEIASGAEVALDFRGDNLYPEGRHDRTLYVTLQFASGAENLFLRGSGKILATQ